MVSPYLPVAISLIIAIVFSFAFVAMSFGFGPHRPTPSKTALYECGMPSIGGGPRQRFSVKFYLVAVLFIIFDLEAVFLFPWSVVYKTFLDLGGAVYVLVEMFLFLGVLFLGWLYCLKRGAFQWD